MVQSWPQALRTPKLLPLLLRPLQPSIKLLLASTRDLLSLVLVVLGFLRVLQLLLRPLLLLMPQPSCPMGLPRPDPHPFP